MNSLIRYVAFFVSIILVAVSCNSIRAQHGDLIYIIISAHILLGGKFIGNMGVDYLARIKIFLKNRKD